MNDSPVDFFRFLERQWILMEKARSLKDNVEASAKSVTEPSSAQNPRGGQSIPFLDVLDHKPVSRDAPQTADTFSKPAPPSGELPVLIFIHGELEARIPEAVKVSFDLGIAGTKLGEHSRILYWADLFEESLRRNKHLQHNDFEKSLESCSAELSPWLSDSVIDVQSKLCVILETDVQFRKAVRDRFVALVQNLHSRPVVSVLHGFAARLCIELQLPQQLDGSPSHWIALAPPPNWKSHSNATSAYVSLKQIIPSSEIPFPRIPGVISVSVLAPTTSWYETPAQKHLENKSVRDVIVPLLGRGFADHVRSFIVAKDVATRAADIVKRQRVLIELNSTSLDVSLEDAKEKLVGAIEAFNEGGGDAEVEIHQRYVSASLTARQIWYVRDLHVDLGISRIWTNSPKRKLTNVSAGRLQIGAARNAYSANGQGIHWAVLDTGVCSSHPHFDQQENVVRAYDCTIRGKGVQVLNLPCEDLDGHGTHVCGIIAGRIPAPMKGIPDCTGMAPSARLHSYKVLDDQGDGDDGFTIKALDHIADVNDRAGRLIIHGINISLGGPFDVEVFGCGQSPICRELRRLWRQGVLICIAAGNEGVISIGDSGNSEPLLINADQTIGDPANLEDAICVGSVHKEAPMLNGISFFSSRGPTADGRAKPDVVAPGEKILSANSGFVLDRPDTWYMPLSGTSMACPHVSGLLAAFLSVRTEFIGRPDEVKSLMKRTAISLNRDVYHQGAGLPNIIEMIRQT